MASNGMYIFVEDPYVFEEIIGEKVKLKQVTMDDTARSSRR